MSMEQIIEQSLQMRRGFHCLVVNDAAIGYSLDADLNAFIPPKQDPTYILNQTTWNWEPDPELEYDLHNDGKKYKYDAENLCWIPT